MSKTPINDKMRADIKGAISQNSKSVEFHALSMTILMDIHEQLELLNNRHIQTKDRSDLDWICPICHEKNGEHSDRCPSRDPQ